MCGLKPKLKRHPPPKWLIEAQEKLDKALDEYQNEYDLRLEELHYEFYWDGFVWRKRGSQIECE